MKFLYLLFILPVVLFSQSMKRDTMRYYRSACDEQNKKDKIEYDKLKYEAADVDFELLTRTIINDLDKRQFTRKFINFRYSVSKLECGVIDGYDCVKEYNLRDPFYSLKKWTTEDLIYLGEKFKDKILIPSKVGSGFGYYEGYYYTDEEDAKKFKKFSKGKVKETDAEFYYYSKKYPNSLSISKNTGMDYIYFSFQNLLNYQVKVYQYINKKKTIKIYEYDGNKWEIIE